MSTVPSGLSLVPAPVPAAEPRSPIPASVEKRIDALENTARRVRHSDHDPEAIHDARVATRRLTAVLDVWKDQLAPGPRAGARRRLRQARRRLGPYREHEVSLARIEKELAQATAATAQVLATIAARLRSHGEPDRAHAAGAVSRGRVEKIIERVRLAILRGPLTAWDSPEALAAADQRVERRRRAAFAALDASLAEPSDEALHAARVAVKKWRYGVEAVEQLRGAGPDPVLSALRDLQELLGANQDRAVLARLLEREARRAAKRGDVPCLHALLERSAALRAENLQEQRKLPAALHRARVASAALPPA